MLKLRNILVLFALTVVYSVASARGNDVSDVLSRADSAYNAKDYRSALSLYNSVRETEGVSPELLHNIGNASFRLGDNGRAVLAYERALRLDQSYDDARASLEYVNSTIKGLPDDGTTFLSNINNSIRKMMSSDGWAVTSLVLFLIILGCAALYLFTSNVALRKTGFFGGIVILFLFIYSLVLAFHSSSSATDRSEVIVIAPGSKLSTKPVSAPSKTDKTGVV
ncbi:MAG: tetratricopeptide repeat protein, partial [Muribaculaceae bacterium]|nr:tetratricopeptide repeat protein [Muribaculaceae bacterium]